MTKAKKTIMVTGAAGALAQQVISRLKEKHNVVAVDFRDLVYLGDDVTTYKVDFNKRGFEDVFRAHDFDAVIHLGRILTTEDKASSRFKGNVLGTQRLLDFSNKYNVGRVIVLSSYMVYGANSSNPALIDEKFPLRAHGYHSAMVDMVEMENQASIYMWKHPDLNITILRPCNIAGPGVRNAVSNLLSGSRAPVMAGYSPVMQFIHLDDLAEAVVATSKKTVPGIFNVAPNDWVTYTAALKASGCTPYNVFAFDPLAYKMAPLLSGGSIKPYMVDYLRYPVVIDGKFFSETFDFKPKHSMREIFDSYRVAKS